MYKIKAPTENYDRKIGGIRFVDGAAETDNAWLASWFSGRPGFTVALAEPVEEPSEDPVEKGRRKPNDKKGAGGEGEKPAPNSAAAGD